jgi:integrase
MPRPRPIYLHRFKTRHGGYVWYVRRPGGNRVRIRGEYGSPEFNAAYVAALDGLSLTQAKPPEAKGSMTWLWGQYRQTIAWTHLKLATRRQRENIMDRVLKKIGHEKCTAIKRAHVAASRDARSATPAQARNFLDAMRGLFRWALEADHIKVDPTAGVKNPPKTKGPGFIVWTENDVDRYQAKWPIGSKERVWLDMLLYTGLRRGDVVKLGRQHIRDGVATLRTEKTDQTVTIPILPVLARTLAAGPTADLAFICGDKGGPLTKESFGNVFKKACVAAGLPKRSAHGVRKIAATTAANNGATVAELEALFGWHGGGMASHYTQDADRVRLAKGAATKLERSICPPEGKVGTVGEKT